jgi:cyanophycin synthetase
MCYSLLHVIESKLRVLKKVDMRLLETKVLEGPNYWSVKRHRLIVAKLDLEELESLPTNKINGFYERLSNLMPSLTEHECSEKHRGGFFERVKEGTWMGHVIEHLALELQWLAGMQCGFGRTRSADVAGVYYIVFSYEHADAGLLALHEAINIAQAVRFNTPYSLEPTVEKLRNIKKEKGFGPSTSSILDEARSRSIPFRYQEDSELIILGHGKFQKKFRGSIVESTSFIGVDLADSKTATKNILKSAGISVPVGRRIAKATDLFNAINEVGFPAVIKPVVGNHGRGVTTNIRTYSELVRAFNTAQKICTDVVVERYIEGNDYRLLVVNYKLVAAAKRTPPCIIGDGYSTINALVERINTDPRRGDGHDNVLTKICIDDATLCILDSKKLKPDSILPEGEKLFLKTTANLSTGGSAADVTDMVNPYNILLAERVSRLLNLDICGIDIMSEGIGIPLTEDTGAVIEVNASPGLRMHFAPSSGLPRNVGKSIVDMLYPSNAQCRVPIVAITGTNGKTTTTRLIAHLAKSNGHAVGCATSDGIYVQEQLVQKGDCTGPKSARLVLGDPTIDFSVLECARGGILRAGLGFDQCDISVVTNISEDHLGLDGILTLDDMVRVKSVVAKSTATDGYAILNADDERVFNISNDLDCKVALFSVHRDNKRITAHRKHGGLAAVIENGSIIVYDATRKIRVSQVDQIPLTFNGRAECMIQNVLSAVLVGIIRKFDLELIRKSLLSFIPSRHLTPGRMNIYHFQEFDVMVDYGHNQGGLAQIKKFLREINASAKIGIITGVGDRRDEDIETIGSLAATMFDQIIIRLDKDLRGRTGKEIVGLLEKGIQKQNTFLKAIIIPDELEALKFAMNTAPKGAFITVFTDEIDKTSNYLERMTQGYNQSITDGGQLVSQA